MRLMSIAQPMWDRLSCLSVLLVVNWEVLRLQYILTKIHILSEKRLSLSSTIHLKVDAPDDWGALYFNKTDPVSSYKYNINNIVYTFTLHAIIRYINWYNTIYINWWRLLPWRLVRSLPSRFIFIFARVALAHRLFPVCRLVAIICRNILFEA